MLYQREARTLTAFRQERFSVTSYRQLPPRPRASRKAAKTMTWSLCSVLPNAFIVGSARACDFPRTLSRLTRTELKLRVVRQQGCAHNYYMWSPGAGTCCGYTLRSSLWHLLILFVHHFDCNVSHIDHHDTTVFDNPAIQPHGNQFRRCQSPSETCLIRDTRVPVVYVDE
jgi:hypothetical protein